MSNVILTFDGDPVVYPRTVCSSGLTRELDLKFKYGDAIGEAVATVSTDSVEITSDNENIQYRPLANPCFVHEGEIYCKLQKGAKLFNSIEHEEFTNGQKAYDACAYWFKCEPIRANFRTPTEIQVDEVLFGAQFEPQVKYEGLNFAPRMMLDIEQFQIGKFLNYEFLTDIKKLAPVAAKYRQIAPAESARRKTLNIGQAVKITCEGRTGILKAIDRNQNVATIAVDGKNLKYRLEDVTAGTM